MLLIKPLWQLLLISLRLAEPTVQLLTVFSVLSEMRSALNDRLGW